jgi:tetratricopeptide (TPR) repeat protein
LAHFCLGEKDLARFSDGALVNTDDKLLLEFHAPRTLYEATAPIIREILENVRTEFMPPITGLSGQLSSQPQILAEIGDVYLGMEKAKEARGFFELALKADASNAKALVGMGRMAGNDKKWTLANGYFSKVKSAEGLAYWGRTLHLAGDNAEGVKKLAEATTLPEAKWEHFFWYAQALGESGDKKAMLEAFGKALNLEPDNLTIQLAYGKALAAVDAKASAAYLEEVRQKYPTYYPLYSDLRDAYGATGNLSSAIDIYLSYVKNNPYSVNAWLNLQRLYGRAGDQARSDRAGERAYALDPFGS